MSRFILLCMCLLSSQVIQAQLELDYYLPGDVSYNPEIPTPEEILGYQIGEWHVSHDQIVYYMRTLAVVSDRIEIENMGFTHEKRPTFLLRISSPGNQKNIEALKAEHVRLSDPSQSQNQDIEAMPLVTWMGYSVHGDEASGGNASLLAAYYLAAAQSDAIDRWLDETIILMEPCINPDGFNRFASWVNSHQGQVPSIDPKSRQFREAWPKGRTNHYWFDLNRDWLPLQHPESQARLAKFHEWKPNLLTDHHEMGSDHTFFFQPGIPSRNNPLTPDNVYHLTGEMAKHHAKALDKIGSLYYTRESYDDFYFGKGSTYPDVNGSVGILFEQAEVQGRARSTPHGIRTFPFAIRNQLTTTLSTLRGGNTLRKDLLEHQREFFRSAIKLSDNHPVKAYVFGDRDDKGKTAHFLEILLRHKIEVNALAKEITADNRTYQPGSHYLVSLNQAQFRLIRSIFEQPTQFQDSLFYDVSAWTLPLSFNLEFSALSAGAYQEDLLGDALLSPPFPVGKLQGEQSRYAYAFSWNEYYSPRLLGQLLERNILCKVASKPFTNSGKTFSYGTIMIPVGLQSLGDEDLYVTLEGLAKECGIEIHSLSSGLSTEGIDLGSRNFSVVKPPRIAMLVDGNVRATEAGEVWHLLDQRYLLPVSMIPVNSLNYTDLSRYNVLIMVDGSYGGAINEQGTERLKSWVNHGGTVVAQKRAGEWLGLNDFANLTYKFSSPDTLSIDAYEDRALARDAQAISGAIFETQLDLSHPLAFGYTRKEMPIFRNSTLFMQSSNKSVSHPINYTSDPLLAGYVSDENIANLKGTAAVAVKRSGSGRVIVFTDDCNFRAFWYGTNKLFANALFFGDAIK